MGLEDEWRERDVKEDPAPHTGSELAAELDVDASPLRPLTGVQILEAVGCHAERSSGTDRERQWRLGGGGGGGELWKAASAKEKSGFPEPDTSQSESRSSEPPGRAASQDGYVLELPSGEAKRKHMRTTLGTSTSECYGGTCLEPVRRRSMTRWDWSPLQAETETKTRMSTRKPVSAPPTHHVQV